MEKENTMANQSNYNSSESQEILQRSEYLKCVSDFAKHMQKEYIDPNNQKMSLFISACDATLEDNYIGHHQVLIGQDCLIVDGLATMMCDKDIQPRFHRARQRANDYGDIEDRCRRRCKRRLRHRRIQTVTFILLALTLILYLASDIVSLMQGEPLVAIASILLTVIYALILHQQWRDLRRKRSRLRNDENERNVAKMANAMQRLFSKFRSEQGEDE